MQEKSETGREREEVGVEGSVVVRDGPRAASLSISLFISSDPSREPSKNGTRSALSARPMPLRRPQGAYNAAPEAKARPCRPGGGEHASKIGRLVVVEADDRGVRIGGVRIRADVPVAPPLDAGVGRADQEGPAEEESVAGRGQGEPESIGLDSDMFAIFFLSTSARRPLPPSPLLLALNRPTLFLRFTSCPLRS